MSKKDRWVPFVPVAMKPATEELIQRWMAELQSSREEAIEAMDKHDKGRQLWANDIYQVEVTEHPETGGVQLNIRRRDGKPILRDWRHFQRIKNEILGPECEAVELYPAESRCVDTSNKYHLWGVRDPTFRFPFGFSQRNVQDDSGTKYGGLRQRRLG